MRRLLGIGALAGLAAGAAAAVFMATVGRGPTRDAIALEEARDHASGAAHHQDLFSRGVQEIGGAVGLLVFGLALGVVFAVVLAAVGPRLGSATPMGAAVRLGWVGFATVVLVPFLKYPANPPAVGDPATVNQRTLAYFAALALSILLSLAVWRLHAGLRAGPVARAWAAAVLYGAGLTVIFLALPANPDPLDAPADLVWPFRMASLGGLAAAWAALALTTGTLLTRWPLAGGPAHRADAAATSASTS